MNIKEGFKYYSNKYKFPRDMSQVNTIYRPNANEDVVLYWINKGFSYWYSGHRIFWRSIKVKGIYGTISNVPKKIKDLFKEVEKEYK